MKMRRGVLKALLIAVVTTVIGSTGSPAPAAAATEETLHKFKGGPTDGANPLGGMILLADGSLLGTASKGAGGGGILFQLDPPAPGGSAWTEKILYNFSKSENPSPIGLTLSGSGSIYGVSGSGGFEFGSIFKVVPPSNRNAAWTIISLFHFGDNADGRGSYPGGTVVEDTSGNLYGIAKGGHTCGYYPPSSSIPFPTPVDCGIVYKLSPPNGKTSAWTETVIYNFKGNSNDGDLPEDLVIGRSGELYGVTRAGGKGCPYVVGQNLQRGCGIVFRLSPPAAGKLNWTETILHYFAGGSLDGGHPVGPLVLDSNGNLYGVASDGYATQSTPQGGGGIFELSPPASGKNGWLETTLWKFSQIINGQIDDRGAFPLAPLTLGKGGALYGTTLSGGRASFGVVFAINPPANGKTKWTETVLHEFTGSDGLDAQDSAMVFDSKTGSLFGVTYDGGLGRVQGFGGNGVVFKVTP